MKNKKEILIQLIYSLGIPFVLALLHIIFTTK